jgi:acyl-CoA synthetase (AMP-forming)/AMP-acid ligase II
VFQLAAVHEAIAREIPERECLVFRSRRLTWADVTDRTRRLASVLAGHGLGCHRERAELRPWESGQDHVALYLYNGNEYLEGMLGAFKARAVPFNVNYRYVDEELEYLFDNADARAVVYHASFAPTLARIRERLPEVRLWLQVEDGSGEPLLPGALDYEKALAQAEPAEPRGLSPDDLYVLYTGGTTGMPKGVLWRQDDVFRAALYTGEVRDPAAVIERARRGGPRALPAPPFMHGAAHWVAFNMWHVGGTVVVQAEPRHLDPADIWRTVERERVTALTIVGDAFGRPLADELRRGRYDLSSLRLITSGGAILTASLKRELLEALPGIRILDALGSSESGQQAAQVSSRDARATTGDFALNPDNAVLKEDLSGPLEPGSSEAGWLARRGCVPLGYYKDPEKTARTFPVVGGVRYAVPGDRAMLEADGTLRLLGRDSVTINTGGEKVFAEEVEHALKHHPAVYDAVVVGTPHERWGQQVTALVRLRDGVAASEESLREEAALHLAPYKLPKRFVFVAEVVRSPSGKADYRWARQAALASAAAGRARSEA